MFYKILMFTWEVVKWILIALAIVIFCPVYILLKLASMS